MRRCQGSLLQLGVVLTLTLLWCAGTTSLGVRLACRRRSWPHKKENSQIAQDCLFAAILTLTIIRHLSEAWAQIRAYRHHRETTSWISVWPVIVSVTAGQLAFVILLQRLNSAFEGTLYEVSKQRFKQYSIALGIILVLSLILYLSYSWSFPRHLLIFYVTASILICSFSTLYAMIHHEFGTRLVALVSRRAAADSKSERTTQLVQSVTPVGGTQHPLPLMEMFDIIEEGDVISEIGHESITPQQSLDIVTRHRDIPAFEAVHSNSKASEIKSNNKDILDVSPIQKSVKHPPTSSSSVSSSIPPPLNSRSTRTNSPSVSPQMTPAQKFPKSATSSTSKLGGLAPLSLVAHNSGSRQHSSKSAEHSSKHERRRSSIIQQVRASSLREFDENDQSILRVAVKQGVLLIGLAVSVITGSVGILVRAHRPYCLGYQSIIASSVTGFSLLMFDLCLYLSFGYSNKDYMFLCRSYDHLFQKMLTVHVKYKISRKINRDERKKQESTNSRIPQ